jgi:hypothetical protein
MKFINMGILVFFVVGMQGLIAGDGSAEVAKSRDEQQIEILRRHVKDAEARVERRAGRIREQDRLVESKINDIIKLLSTVKDSAESKTRVTQVKEDVINGLNKSLEFYRQRRRARVQKLRDERVTFQDAADDKVLAFLDAKIDKRIEQITHITSTLTKGREWKKHEKYNYTVYGNNVEREVSDEFTRHRKNLSRSHRQSDRTVAIIKQNEADVRKESERLESRLKSAGSDEEREAIKNLMAKNDARLKKQEGEIRKIARPQGGGRALGRKDAFDTQKWIENMAEEVVREHRELVRMISDSKQDVMMLNNWKQRLKKAEEYMAKREASGSSSEKKP